MIDLSFDEIMLGSTGSRSNPSHSLTNLTTCTPQLPVSSLNLHQKLAAAGRDVIPIAIAVTQCCFIIQGLITFQNNIKTHDDDVIAPEAACISDILKYVYTYIIITSLQLSHSCYNTCGIVTDNYIQQYQCMRALAVIT